MQLTVKLNPKPASFSHTWINAVQLPQGATYTAHCPVAECHLGRDGRRYLYGGTGSILFRITPAAVGKFEMVVGLQWQPSPGSGFASPTAEPVLSTVRVPFSVLPLDEPPPLDVTKWESLMLKLGEKWCDPAKVYAFGYEGDAWYYDGGRVFFQISDYTQNSKWEACAFHVVNQYRDNLLSRNGGIQGWRVFPHGLFMAYQRTGDESYKRAAVLMSQKSSFAHTGGALRDPYIRETAYAVQAYIVAEKLGEPRHPMLARSVNFLLGHFDMLFRSGNYELHQTFYDGLASEALIQWYEHSKDPRVVPAIRSMLDWIWNVGWRRSDFRLVYNAEPLGPKCDNSCQSYGRAWINLVVPAFGWYYAVTRDPLYRDRGDEIWSHALDDDISYSGKIFSQNYRWSFDYVHWRRGGLGQVSKRTVASANSGAGE
ncbi:MAG: hypothetical protein IT160_07035 [Bryobacterales bacterium]|nr:hypothetical protein [Bryobacterales bacterium]